MTIVPRTGPLSAISARAMTSWYQRGKSSARDTIAPLLMAAQVTGARRAPRPDRWPGAAPGLRRRAAAVDDLDLRRSVVGVDARRLQQLAAVRLRLRLGAGVRRRHAGLD